MQPEKIIQQFLIFIRQNSIIFLLVLFVFVDVVFAPAIYSQNNKENNFSQAKIFLQKDSLQNSANKNTPKISQISGPRIADGAASVERIFIDSVKEKENFCSTLPTGIWTFLLLAYIGLLIFNLSYNFKGTNQIQWGFELGLTFLAIIAWYAFGGARCGANSWYPPLVLKTGILTYAIYLYFFDKKRIKDIGVI